MGVVIGDISIFLISSSSTNSSIGEENSSGGRSLGTSFEKDLESLSLLRAPHRALLATAHLEVPPRSSPTTPCSSSTIVCIFCCEQTLVPTRQGSLLSVMVCEDTSRLPLGAACAPAAGGWTEEKKRGKQEGGGVGTNGSGEGDLLSDLRRTAPRISAMRTPQLGLVKARRRVGGGPEGWLRRSLLP